jgi:arabinan endo-1,5-alpha-L-arabinosidase
MRLLAALLIAASVQAAAQNISAPFILMGGAPPSYSDEFSGATLDPKWTEYEPPNTATVSVGSGVLTVSIPAGSDHDLYTGIDNALRLRQTYTGSANFTLEMKVTSTMASNIQFFGLIVEEDDNDMVRHDMVLESLDHNMSGSRMIGGTYTSNWWTNIGDPTQPYWLRIVKTGTDYVCSYSLNGSSWTTSGTISWSGTVNRIGLMVGTASGGSSPAFTCTIDYFNYSAN